LSFIACSLSCAPRARSERLLFYDICALEMFLLAEVHEEKRLKERASSVYFTEKDREAGVGTQKSELISKASCFSSDCCILNSVFSVRSAPGGNC
jgi:hypothetical protein